MSQPIHSPPEPLSETQQRLVEDHLSLARAIARGWRGRCRTAGDFEELVQVGSLGLVDAARRYDEARGATFAAMAAERIRGAICDHFRALDPLTRDRRKAVRDLDEAQRRERTRLGREPAPGEIAAALGWDERRVAAARDDAAALAAGWARPQDGSEWAERTAADDGDGPDRGPLGDLLRRETVAQLRQALEDLPERDRLILDLYFREGLQLHEIGTILGVTESRVSQIRTAALARLRARLGAGAAVAVA